MTGNKWLIPDRVNAPIGGFMKNSCFRFKTIYNITHSHYPWIKSGSGTRIAIPISPFTSTKVIRGQQKGKFFHNIIHVGLLLRRTCVTRRKFKVSWILLWCWKPVFKLFNISITHEPQELQRQWVYTWVQKIVNCWKTKLYLVLREINSCFLL